MKSVLVKVGAGWFCEWMITNLLKSQKTYALIKGHKEKKRKRDDMTMNLSHNIIMWVCPHFLCWISGVVPFNSWLISSWEEHICCYNLSTLAGTPSEKLERKYSELSNFHEIWNIVLTVNDHIEKKIGSEMFR